MDQKQVKAWAQRRRSSAQDAEEEDFGSPPPKAAPTGAAAGPPGPPPAGYGWTWDAASGQYLLVGLGAPQAAPQPLRQPQGARPYAGSHVTPAGRSISAKTRTCQLVKDDGLDPHSIFLDSLPDLAPMDPEYDAMDGRPSPESIQRLQDAAREHAADSPELASTIARIHDQEIPRPRGMVAAEYRQFPAKEVRDEE